MNLSEFARRRASELLGRLAFEVRNVCAKKDPEAVHDLRVSIRRFTQALLALQPLFPRREAKRIRRRLRAMMDLAARIRNRDIATGLFTAAGVARDAPVFSRLAGEREQARGELVRLARSWRSRNFTGRWRTALRLRGRPTQ